MEHQQIIDLPGKTDVDIYEAEMKHRFLNYIVDVILAYGLNLLTGMGIGYLLFKDADSMDEEELNHLIEIVDNRLVGYGMTYSVFFIYYFLCEHFMNGKTPGKFLTRTRAVTRDGYRMKPGRTAIRSLCRLIPFDALSFLGNHGWHDTISRTIVVEDRSVLPTETL
ncbi:MAG: RDD family protein [Flavobacteriales bacterium]|nr:RDD family protein [Flavobacteriales bacterium]